MNFGNNIEKYAFEKGVWPLVDIVNDSASQQTIYMGRPRTPNADENDPVWFIRKIIIRSGEYGQRVHTWSTRDFNNKWSEREYLDYDMI